MRVLFIAEHGDMPSIRLRLTNLFDRYRAAGIEPTLLTTRSDLGERLRLIREAGRHDVVVLHRTTGLSPLQLTLLRRANPRIIFDFDDALMFRDQKYGQPLRVRTFAKFVRTIESCSAVVAGNEFLGCFARVFIHVAVNRCWWRSPTAHLSGENANRFHCTAQIGCVVKERRQIK